MDGEKKSVFDSVDRKRSPKKVSRDYASEQSEEVSIQSSVFTFEQQYGMNHYDQNMPGVGQYKNLEHNMKLIEDPKVFIEKLEYLDDEWDASDAELIPNTAKARNARKINNSMGMSVKSRKMFKPTMSVSNQVNIKPVKKGRKL